MPVENPLGVVMALLSGVILLRILLHHFYTPESWLRFFWCFVRFHHNWGEKYRPDTEGYSPEIQKCECCGIKKKANPPAPLVP